MMAFLKYLICNKKWKSDHFKNDKKPDNFLGIGIVDRAFHPVLGGRIRFQGTTWPAFTDQDETFNEEDIVRVLKRVGISLKVEKYS